MLLVRIMELKLCVLFLLCVCGYPLQVSNKATNNYKKPAPTISDIKVSYNTVVTYFMILFSASICARYENKIT